MKLKKTQKNELFEALEMTDLPLSMFTLKEGDSCIIQVNNHPYFFTFTENFKGISISYCPGLQSYRDIVEVRHFDDVMKCFHNWADVLEEEIETDDKWENFNKLVASLDITQQHSYRNDKFDAAEFLQLTNNITALKNRLSEISLSKTDIKLIHNKLDHIMEQAYVLGKFDWTNLLIGTIISIIIQLSLSQQQGADLISLIKRIFSLHFLPA